jgi:hypothetical protein
MVTWNVSIEHNNKKIQAMRDPLKQTQEKISKNTSKTRMNKKCQEEDPMCVKEEQPRKVDVLEIQMANIPHLIPKNYQVGPNLPNWKAPNSPYVKLNFNRSLKGNPS